MELGTVSLIGFLFLVIISLVTLCFYRRVFILVGYPEIDSSVSNNPVESPAKKQPYNTLKSQIPDPSQIMRVNESAMEITTVNNKKTTKKETDHVNNNVNEAEDNSPFRSPSQDKTMGTLINYATDTINDDKSPLSTMAAKEFVNSGYKSTDPSRPIYPNPSEAITKANAYGGSQAVPQCSIVPAATRAMGFSGLIPESYKYATIKK